MSVTDTRDVATADLDAVDLMDPAWWRDGPPHELFARMRAETPVRWNPSPDGGGFWSLTRHAEVSEASRDFERFSSWRAGVFLHPDQVLPLDVTRNLLLYKDPPEHTKYRRILQRAMTPHAVAQLDGVIRGEARAVVDAVVERGACDAVADLAVPLPLRILAQLIGVPAGDVPRLYAWTQGFEDAARSPEPAQATATLMEMGGYLAEQIERQVAEGDEDSLVMQLRRAEVDGVRLDDTEILVFFGLLVFGGNDTTRNTTSSGLLALLEHPDQLALLRERPELLETAVEEVLRWTSVVNWFARTANHGAEVGGVPIPEGEKVVMWYSSASRDEEVFPDPQRFDVTRGSSEHKAFGGGGRHFCLGAGLARAELRAILGEVVSRLDGLELDGEVERVQHSWTNSLTRLPVRFRPGARAAPRDA